MHLNDGKCVRALCLVVSELAFGKKEETSIGQIVKSNVPIGLNTCLTYNFAAPMQKRTEMTKREKKTSKKDCEKGTNGAEFVLNGKEKSRTFAAH